MAESPIYLSPPLLAGSELDRIREALDSNWIAPLGPQVDAFEREFAAAVAVPHAAALSSGTAALHLALRLVGVQPGDEVLCSTLTFVASTNAIRYLGAEPVLIDASRGTWNLDPDLLEAELESSARSGKLPKAVVVVDLYGQSADYDRIVPICKRFDVPVVEDAAEALGATYRGRPVGSFGHVGTFSFNGNKIITTSGGGMLVASDPELVARARFLAAQAREQTHHYEHKELGYNYRMSNLLAAVGRAQLADLERRVKKRRKNFELYREAFAGCEGLDFMPEADYGRSNRWLTCLLVDRERFGASPEAIRLALEAEAIEARPVWKPMHRQPLYAGCRAVLNGVADELFANGLCLPSGTELRPEQIERIAGIVRHAPQRSTAAR